jgi:dipeptidyl aminopeptidase/acylaminoacyl peptidase
MNVPLTTRALLVLLALFVPACAAPTGSPPPTVAPATETVLPPPTATFPPPQPPSPTPTQTLTLTPTAPPTPTPTPEPFAAYYVESLRARVYGEGPIEIVATLQRTSAFTRYLIAYPSDGLRITGMMNVPAGEGPFPVVVLNHGYYDPAVYTTGRGTQPAADTLARHGYLTLASDYRNYAGSDSGPDPFRAGYAVDVLNLIASVGSLPQARAEAIGVWGHSMGGGIALAAMVVDPPGLRAAVLYGAMSGDFVDNYYRIAYFRGADTPGPEWPVAPPDAPEAYARLSPINYLHYVSVPTLIHHGELDATVPLAWSLRLAQALRDAGRDATLYTYPAAGHSFFDADWNTFMTRNVEFFDRLLRPAD